MPKESEKDALVRKVTEEVMAQLKAGLAPPASPPASAPAPTPPPAAPSAPSSAPAPAPTGPSRAEGGAKALKGRSLVVLAGDRGDVEAVLAQVRAAARASGGVTVVLSEAAERLVPRERLAEAAPGAVIVASEDEPDVLALLREATIVLIPVLDLASASKMAETVTDTVPVKLAVFGALQGKAVVAARDGLPLAGLALEQVPAGARKRLEGMQRGLAELGISLVDLKDLAGGDLALVCTRRDECLACGLCVINNPDSVRGIIEAGADRIGAAAGSKVDDRAIARTIDHTLLRADATREQIRKLCEEAVQYGFASVCVNPANVAQASELVKGTAVKVCTVIGFPLGATTATAKAIETRDAIANGAQEIDMVINVGALKSGDDDLVRRDVEAVVDASRGKAIVKVILETALLTKQEKVRGCLLAKMAGADFVKTSTGFGPSGATVEDVALMRATVGPEMGVKASGGIRDTATAKAMIAAGATRIGASASVAITKGAAKG